MNSFLFNKTAIVRNVMSIYLSLTSKLAIQFRNIDIYFFEIGNITRRRDDMNLYFRVVKTEYLTNELLSKMLFAYYMPREN